MVCAALKPGIWTILLLEIQLFRESVSFLCILLACHFGRRQRNAYRVNRRNTVNVRRDTVRNRVSHTVPREETSLAIQSLIRRST